MPLSVAVVGLGRIGLSFATFLASKGVLVKGVEVDQDRSRMIRSGKISSQEPELEDLFFQVRSMVHVTDLETAINSVDLSFVIVPTPSRADGHLSDDFVSRVVSEIALNRTHNERHHLAVIISTVSPGSIDSYQSVHRDILRKSGVELCYSPVFVAQGTVLENLRNPPFLLVGASGAKAREALTAFYLEIGYKESLIVSTTVINAEIAKLALNAFLANKIAFANSVAAVCDRIANADANEVLGIIGRDSRIGEHYLKRGTPFGGPCLPRDNGALIAVSTSNRLSFNLFRAVEESNEHWYRDLRTKVLGATTRGSSVFGIVGLTYKSKTDFMENGFGIRLAKDLLDLGHRVIAHDPGFQSGFEISTFEVEFTDNLTELVTKSDVCVLTWPDKAMSSCLREQAGHTRVVDIWDGRPRSTEV